MTQTNFNFTTPDSIKGITEADYQQIIPCVETVRSLAQTTYQSIYIIDLYKKNEPILYIKDVIKNIKSNMYIYAEEDVVYAIKTKNLSDFPMVQPHHVK